MNENFEKDTFSSAKEVLNTLFDNIPQKDELQKKSNFLDYWGEICGKKLSKYTCAIDITDEGVLTIKCENSAAANELMLQKTSVSQKLNKKASEYNIKFTEIKIVYR